EDRIEEMRPVAGICLLLEESGVAGYLLQALGDTLRRSIQLEVDGERGYLDRIAAGVGDFEYHRGIGPGGDDTAIPLKLVVEHQAMLRHHPLGFGDIGPEVLL